MDPHVVLGWGAHSHFVPISSLVDEDVGGDVGFKQSTNAPREPSSGSDVVPRRARPGLHFWWLVGARLRKAYKGTSLIRNIPQ